MMNPIANATNGLSYSIPTGTTVDCKYDKDFHDNNKTAADEPMAATKTIEVYKDSGEKMAHGIHIGGLLVALRPEFAHLGMPMDSVYQAPNVVSNLNGLRLPATPELREIMRIARTDNELGQEMFQEYMRRVFVFVGFSTKPFETGGGPDEVNDEPVALIDGKMTVLNQTKETWHFGDRLICWFPLPEQPPHIQGDGDQTLGRKPWMRAPYLRKYTRQMHITEKTVQRTLKCTYPPPDVVPNNEDPALLRKADFLETALVNFAKQILFGVAIAAREDPQVAYQKVFAGDAAFERMLQRVVCCSVPGVPPDMLPKVHMLPPLLQALFKNWAYDQEYAKCMAVQHAGGAKTCDVMIVQ